MEFQTHAPGGLTAIELIALANWLEATNFPAAICVYYRRLLYTSTLEYLPVAAKTSAYRRQARDPRRRRQCHDLCSNSASTLTTWPRCARRGIAGADCGEPDPSRRRGFAKPPARTASPRICARTGGTSRTATSGGCAKSSRRG